MPEIARWYVRKLWFPYRGAGARLLGRGVMLPPPRAVQLLRRAQCARWGHRWSRWRVETGDWFKYVAEPLPGAMRRCERGCGALERVLYPSSYQDYLIRGFSSS